MIFLIQCTVVQWYPVERTKSVPIARSFSKTKFSIASHTARHCLLTIAITHLFLEHEIRHSGSRWSGGYHKTDKKMKKTNCTKCQLQNIYELQLITLMFQSYWKRLKRPKRERVRSTQSSLYLIKRTEQLASQQPWNTTQQQQVAVATSTHRLQIST